MRNRPVIVLLGPPGAGKGTASGRLAARLNREHVSSGDMLRAAIRSETLAGKQAASFMSRGELVPDELVGRIISEHLREYSGAGTVLDGFPRTVAQAEMLKRMLKESDAYLEGVFWLKVPEESLVFRMSGRRICESCGAVFHVQSMPPKRDGVCDACGGKLIRRADDDPSTVRNRLEVFARQTAPLLDWYDAGKELIVIDAAGEPEVVVERILNQVPSFERDTGSVG